MYAVFNTHFDGITGKKLQMERTSELAEFLVREEVARYGSSSRIDYMQGWMRWFEFPEDDSQGAPMSGDEFLSYVANHIIYSSCYLIVKDGGNQWVAAHDEKIERTRDAVVSNLKGALEKYGVSFKF